MRQIRRRLLVLAATLTLAPALAAVTGSTAAAAAPALGVAAAAPALASTCAGTWQAPGALASGTYRGLTVSGVCIVDDTAAVTIYGNVRIEPGGVLLAAGHQTWRSYGNILLGRGATLALFCAQEVGCDNIVRGNVVARNALSMYLLGSTVYGQISFLGGGWGRDCVDNDPAEGIGHGLIFKDNLIRGSVNLDGWSGCWMGFLRNTVHGAVRIANMYANPENIIINPETGEQVTQGLDSTEVVGNQIWGVLSCTGNTPLAQFGDAAPIPNVVHGVVTGECAHMEPPAPPG